MRQMFAIGSAALLAACALIACQSEQPPSNSPPTVEASPAARKTGPIDLTPRRTRDGHLRIANESIHDNPAATVALFKRFDAEPDAEVRTAIAEALPRTGGDWGEGTLERLASEPEPSVRKAIVATMVRAEPSIAVRGIAAGLADPASEVRLEAAFAAGSVPVEALRSAGLLTRLRETLDDDTPRVRAMAARSLGVLGVGDAFKPITPLLEDADPEVRLQALRALSRLDAKAAAALPALRALRGDSDRTVSRAAERIVDAQQ